MKLFPLPAFLGNNIRILHDGHQCLVVDPRYAHAPFKALQHVDVSLKAILVTHHDSEGAYCVGVWRKETGAVVPAGAP